MLIVTILISNGCGDESPSANLDSEVEPILLTECSWDPSSVSWQWQLTGEINQTYEVDIYDVDLFETSTEVISQLKSSGSTVLCYFSAGSSEDWRPDYNSFADSDLGRKLDGWDGENWLDIRSANVYEIMLKRLDLAVEKGCDGVEPDNINGYENRTGFDLTETDQLAFNRNLANAAHERDLCIALKNEGAQATELVSYYDLALTEQCIQYDECNLYQPFLDATKPVINAEYQSEWESSDYDSICNQSNAASIRTLILNYDLDDSFRYVCWE